MMKMKIMVKIMMVEAATEVLTKSPQPSSRPSLLLFSDDSFGKKVLVSPFWFYFKLQWLTDC